MAIPTTRNQFKDYCLRRLGAPVIEINIDEDQVLDRIDDALQFFNDYHFDGVEKIFMKHKITEADKARGWIYVPDSVIFVTGVLPYHHSGSSVNQLGSMYQIELTAMEMLFNFTSYSTFSYVDYDIMRQHLRTLELMFTGTPQFRFHRHSDKLYLDINWSRITVGEYIILEAYRALSPDVFTASGTANVSTTSTTVTGTGTVFDRNFIPGDNIYINDEQRRVVSIESPTSLTVDAPFTSSANNQTITMVGVSDVWNDRFLKQYATAKIKEQWGNNMKKFNGVQLPGGVTMNGQQIYEEAREEIKQIEEELQVLNVLPPEILVG